MSCSGADELEPPWAAYPWIPLGSIGWRMGSGEGYMIEWGEAVRCSTVDQALEYLQRHPPAPHSWRRWIASWLARIGVEDSEIDDDEDDDDDEATSWDERVEEEGLIAEDAAYPVFVRNALREGGMTVPWASARATPHGALRYSARELGWWARWLATACPDRGAYLDAQPPPPDAWVMVERSARTGVAAVPYETGGLEALVCTLAATGTLPPAWIAGHEPRGGIEYGDDADDRDRWLWWVTETFDDAASWQRYLAAWPPAPESWGTAFAEHYLALG
jgi:hypothetical protein